MTSWPLTYRYNLQKDVRESLYEGGNAWVNFLKGRKFVGGDQPNLADLVCVILLYCCVGCDSYSEYGDWQGVWFYAQIPAFLLQWKSSKNISSLLAVWNCVVTIVIFFKRNLQMYLFLHYYNTNFNFLTRLLHHEDMNS